MPRQTTPANDPGPFGGLGTVADHAPAAPDDKPLDAQDTARIRELGNMITDLPRSNTPVGMATTGMNFRDIAEQARRQLGSATGVRERKNPKTDKYSPTSECENWQSEEAQALYNHVGPGRTVVWVRRDGEQADDRSLADLMRRIPEAQIVTSKDTDEDVRSWDLVAVAIPEEYELRRIIDEAERADNWESAIVNETLHNSVTENHPHYEDEKRRANAMAKQRSREMGLGVNGVSPGAGFGRYEEGYKRALGAIPIEDTRALEERSRRGNRHEMQMTDQQAARMDRERRGGNLQFGGLQGSDRYNQWETSKDRQTRERGQQPSGGRR